MTAPHYDIAILGAGLRRAPASFGDAIGPLMTELNEKLMASDGSAN